MEIKMAAKFKNKKKVKCTVKIALICWNYLNSFIGIHKLFHLKHLALLVNHILILPITRSALFDAIALAEIDTDLLV